jgi:hypothetical protein
VTYPADHQAAIPGNSNFSVDSYNLTISPALAFAYTWSVGRVIGLIVWFGVGLFLYLASNDLIGRNEGTIGAALAKNPVKTLIVGMLVAAFLVFAPFSKLVAGNYKATVPTTRYEQIKENKDSLKALFPKQVVY